MRGQVAPAHTPQQHQECRVPKGLAGLAARKHKHVIRVPVRLHLLEDGERANGERDPMLPSRFDASGWYGPSLVAEVELVPPRAHRLTGSCGREHREFE